MKRYDAIIEASPLPVFIINQKDLPDKYCTINGVRREYYGLYIRGFLDPVYPSEFFFLRKNTSPAQIITSFFHELRHYECYITKCLCSNTEGEFVTDNVIVSTVLREKHGMINELEMAWEMKDTLLISSSMNSIATYILGEDVTPIYRAAAYAVSAGDIICSPSTHF